MAEETETTGDAAEDVDSPPGRPVAADEIDPELLRLPRPRTPIGPLLALSVVVFCLYMMIRLRDDLVFSRQGEEPREVDSVEALLADDGPGDESFVRLWAVPDRAYAAKIGASAAEAGHRATPLLGSDGGAWLVLDGNVWATEITYDEVYTGRVRELSDMPFSDQVRQWARDRAPQPRFVTGQALREAVEAGARTVSTPAGDALALRSDTPIELRIQRGERSLIHAPLHGEHPDEDAWRASLTGAGIELVGAPRRTSDRDRDLLVFTADTGVEAARTALERARLLSAFVDPVVEHRQTTFGALSVAGGGFAVGDAVIPATDVRWAAVASERHIPDDALVLVTGERPGAYWYILPLYVVMALFVVLFSWALVRSLRTAATEGHATTGSGAPVET